MSVHGVQLIAGYLDGGLSPHESGELAELVAGDLDARRRLIEAARMHRQLLAELRHVDLSGMVLAELRHDGERYVERVMDDVRTQLRRRPSARLARRRWLMPALFAASIAAAVLAWQGSAGQRGDRVVVDGAHSIGTLSLIEGGAGRLLPPGTALPGGAQVAPAGPSSGVVFADGTSIMLMPGAQLRLGASAAGGKRLELSAGALTATVAKQPAGKPLLVSTPRLLATVVGTSFSVRTAGDSFLAVSNGLVHVRELAHGSEFDIGKGESLLVRSAGEALRSRATLWSLISQWPRVVTAGRPLRDADSTEAAIGSVAYRPLTVNPYFAPEQYVCMQSGKLSDHERQLFLLPEGFRLHLRVRAERAGTAMVTMQPPTVSAGNTPNHGSRRFAVDTGWGEIVLAAGDFEAPSAPRTLVAGYPIACISLWGFSSGVLQLAEATLESAAP